MERNYLTKFIYLSIAAAIVTIMLKALAYFVTGSVGLLSDALESIVNLVAATIALFTLKIAQKPPDENHLYGHSKAEYFSSIFEGTLIFVAAIVIAYSAIIRFISPQPLEQATLGIIVSGIASAINFFIARKLLSAGKKYQSIVLEADARHLFTDVWTSVGVIMAVMVVSVTHINILDPIIAFVVALNIIYTGYKLIKRSVLGFLDTAISSEENAKVISVLEKYITRDIKYHALRTRQAGTRKFISVHILVPGEWTIQKGHDLLEKIEKDVRKNIANVSIIVHLEPIEDFKSFEDIQIDRKDNRKF